MLRRKITEKLLSWKKEDKKPCLLIKGARQVGKTFIVDAFAKANYKNYLYINFELMPEYKKIFSGNLDFSTLRMNLEVTFPDTKIEKGETLLFLDEIQSCPNARVALKTFALDGTIDVVASGSLLGLYQKEVSSYPVGYERALELLPLDFEEFLWALGISDEIISVLRASFKTHTPLPDSISQRIEDYFEQFMLVGGMPNVVNAFLREKSPQSIRVVQKEIIDSYKNDILKYSSTADKPKILKTFESVPMQLARKNKKFMFSEISPEENNVGERKYGSSVLWLKDAGIINFCYNLATPALPLAVNRQLNSYKIYMRDTGLLVSMLDVDIAKAILSSNLRVNEGSLLENVFAEEIYSRYEDVTFFERRGKLEIDFILDKDGVATAVEVKSGTDRRSKSLNSIIDNYKMVERYMKFEKILSPETDQLGIEHYPLFMAMFL